MLVQFAWSSGKVGAFIAQAGQEATVAPSLVQTPLAHVHAWEAAGQEATVAPSLVQTPLAQVHAWEAAGHEATVAPSLVQTPLAHLSEAAGLLPGHLVSSVTMALVSSRRQLTARVLVPSPHVLLHEPQAPTPQL